MFISCFCVTKILFKTLSQYRGIPVEFPCKEQQSNIPQVASVMSVGGHTSGAVRLLGASFPSAPSEAALA